MTGDVGAATAEQRDEQRKLDAGEECGRQNDDARDDRPAREVAGEAEDAEAAETERDDGEAVPESERERERSASSAQVSASPRAVAGRSAPSSA